MRHSLAALGLLVLLTAALAGCASSTAPTSTFVASPTPELTLPPDPAWQYSRTFVAAAFAKQSWDAADPTTGKKWVLVFGQEAKTTNGLAYVQAKDSTNKISVAVFGPTAAGNVTQVLIIDSNPGFGSGRDIMEFAIGLMVDPDHAIGARAQNGLNLEYDNGTALGRQGMSVEDQQSFGSTIVDLAARQPGNYPTSISLTLEPGFVTTTHSTGVAGTVPAPSGQAGGFVISGADLTNYYSAAAQGFSCQPSATTSTTGFILSACSKTDAAGNKLMVGIYTTGADQVVDTLVGIESSDDKAAVVLDASDRAFLTATPELLFGHSPIMVKITTDLSGALGIDEVGWGVSQDFSFETYLGDNQNSAEVWVEGVSQASAAWTRPNVPFVAP